QFFNAELRGVGIVRQGLVQIRDVRSVMLVVMDLHRLGIDVRLECVERVGELRHFKARREDVRTEQRLPDSNSGARRNAGGDEGTAGKSVLFGHFNLLSIVKANSPVRATASRGALC